MFVNSATIANNVVLSEVAKHVPASVLVPLLPKLLARLGAPRVLRIVREADLNALGQVLECTSVESREAVVGTLIQVILQSDMDSVLGLMNAGVAPQVLSQGLKELPAKPLVGLLATLPVLDIAETLKHVSTRIVIDLLMAVGSDIIASIIKQVDLARICTVLLHTSTDLVIRLLKGVHTDKVVQMLQELDPLVVAGLLNHVPVDTLIVLAEVMDASLLVGLVSSVPVDFIFAVLKRVKPARASKLLGADGSRKIVSRLNAYSLSHRARHGNRVAFSGARGRLQRRNCQLDLSV
jgi:Mg/Co/Ni transporter MgtE